MADAKEKMKEKVPGVKTYFGDSRAYDASKDTNEACAICMDNFSP